jgi:cell division protein FtsB
VSSARAAARPLHAVPAPDRDPARRRHLRVAPDRRRRRRLRLALALGVAVSVASTFLLVAFNVLVVQGQFDLERLSQQLEVEQRAYAHGRLEVAQLASPDAIVERARRLGMIEPAQVTYVEAPAAVAPTDELDTTSSTLQDSWAAARSSLGVDP